jgi:hypothetical protein
LREEERREIKKIDFRLKAIKERIYFVSLHSGQIWGGPQISSKDSRSGTFAPNTMGCVSVVPRMMYGVFSGENLIRFTR